MIGGLVFGYYGIIDIGYVDYPIDFTKASLFTFNDACNLVSVDTGGTGIFPAGATGDVFYFDTGGYQGGYVPAVRNLVEGLLIFHDQSANIFEYCTSYPVWITDEVAPGDGCTQFMSKGCFNDVEFWTLIRNITYICNLNIDTQRLNLHFDLFRYGLSIPASENALHQAFQV
jgi:hypothetical protein